MLLIHRDFSQSFYYIPLKGGDSLWNLLQILSAGLASLPKITLILWPGVKKNHHWPFGIKRNDCYYKPIQNWDTGGLQRKFSGGGSWP